MDARDQAASAEIKIRMKEPLRAEIERAARRRGVSMNAEMVDRLERSFAETAYPPEIAALAELLARVMTDAGRSIEGGNRHAGYGFVNWLDDPYAFSQAAEAAIHVLELSAPKGSKEPHGLFASPAWLSNAKEMGRRHADGILEVMRGRHTEPGAIAVQWAPRVRRELGIIGDRLDDQPVPVEYHVRTRYRGDKPVEF